MERLASLIASVASGEAAHAMRRAREAAIAYLLAGAAVICGIGFLVGAGYIWTAEQIGSIEAALAFGVGFLVLAGLVLVIYHFAARRKHQREARRRNKDMAMVAATSALAVLPALLRRRIGLGAVAVPAAAAVAYAIFRENTRKPGDKNIGGEG
jgi:hypothetical protein